MADYKPWTEWFKQVRKTIPYGASPYVYTQQDDLEYRKKQGLPPADVKYKQLKDHLQFGNEKLSENICIFNLGSALGCPSRKTGECQLDDPERCYALGSEKMYGSPYFYRERQKQLWKTISAEQFARHVGQAFKKKEEYAIRARSRPKPKPKLIIKGKKKKKKKRVPFNPDMPYLMRFDEAGDFSKQSDVKKMSKIADILKKDYGIRTYTYTAKSSLDYRKVSKNLTINRSNWTSKKQPKKGTNVFQAVVKPTSKYICPGTASRECGSKCMLCVGGGNKLIQVKKH